MRTNPEPHSERLHVRLTPTEVAALELLTERWHATRSQLVRSLIIGATLSELDQLEALDAIESGSAVAPPLVDLPDLDGLLVDP